MLIPLALAAILIFLLAPLVGYIERLDRTYSRLF
jgi:predicted PurR-regulated permease PerM